MSNVTVGLFTKQTGWNVSEVKSTPEYAYKIMEKLWEERNQLREQVNTLLLDLASAQGTNMACEEIITDQAQKIDVLEKAAYQGDDEEGWD